MLSVIIPANNEQSYIGRCLDGIMGQSLDPASVGGAEIVVAANGCTDRTVAVAEGYLEHALAKGWRLTVLDIPQGGKVNALNRADAVASGDMRAYLDADVVLSPLVLEQVAAALNTPVPSYASGTLTVAPAQSWVTRHFARVWIHLPFMTTGVPGAGLFAVNGPGRARWKDFPPIIADDAYVRLHFSPRERLSVPATYTWPMTEGFNGLVKVRRRQDIGGAEVAELYPDMMANEGKPPLTFTGMLRLAKAMPVSFAVYSAVLLLVRITAWTSSRDQWSRGR